MKHTINRRRVLTGATMAATSIAMPWVRSAGAALMPLRCGTATPGFTVVFFDYVRDNKLDEKHGFKLAGRCSTRAYRPSIASLLPGRLT